MVQVLSKIYGLTFAFGLLILSTPAIQAGLPALSWRAFQGNGGKQLGTANEYRNASPVEMLQLIAQTQAMGYQILATLMFNPGPTPLPLSKEEGQRALPPESLVIFAKPFAIRDLLPAPLPRMACAYSIHELEDVDTLFSNVETVWNMNFVFHKVFLAFYKRKARLQGRIIVLHRQPFPESIPELTSQFKHGRGPYYIYFINSQAPPMVFVVHHDVGASTFHLNACNESQIATIRDQFMPRNIENRRPTNSDMLWLTVVGTYTWIYGA